MAYDKNSPTYLVSSSKTHPNMYKTLVLLRLYERNGSPVYFIVEGLNSLAQMAPESPIDDSYFYNEHTCPTNYIGVEAVFTPNDDDPHGVFEYVRTAWYPASYDAAKAQGEGDAFLRALFPETLGGTVIDGELTRLFPTPMA